MTETSNSAGADLIAYYHEHKDRLHAQAGEARRARQRKARKAYKRRSKRRRSNDIMDRGIRMPGGPRQ